LGSLLNLLQSSEDETIRQVAAGVVANLTMNGEGYMLCSSCMTHALLIYYGIIQIYAIIMQLL
jgi:hypothetical protein